MNDWKAHGTANWLRIARLALAVGVAAVAVSACSGVKRAGNDSPASLAIDCKTMPAVCERSAIALEAVDLARISYLETIGACGRTEACSKGIKPNSSDPILTQRLIRFSFDQCVAIRCASYPAGSDALAECARKSCGSPSQ